MKKELTIAIILVFITFSLNAQIEAAFTADVTQGCDELTIQFTDESTSTETITTWEWDLGDGNTATAQDLTHIYNTPAEYSICLTVTNSLGEMDTHCETNYISVLETPIADAGPNVTIDCVSPSVTLDASASSSGPNITYEWIAPSGAVISASPTTNVNSSGTYTLVVSNSGVCESMDEVDVLEDFTVPIANITQGSSCTFPYTLSSAGSSTGPGIIYEWLNEAGDVIGTDIEVVIDEPGFYTLVVVNNVNGCFSEETIEVTDIANGPIEVSMQVQDVSCFNSDDGAIDLTITGGVPGYTFLWNDAPGSTTEDINGLEGGIYTVTVTDSNNCTAEATSTIVEPTELILTFNTQCATASSGGTIDVSVSGGTAPYLYDWSNGISGTSTINNLDFGTYNVTITDANACTVVGEAGLGNTINSISGGDTTYCENTQAQLEVVAPNAVTYEWSPGNLSCYDCPNPIATVGLGEETFYSVTVTEADDCIDVGYVNFNVQSYLDFNLLEFSNSPVFVGEDIVFDCNVPNASSVEWTGPNGFQSSECNPIIANGSVTDEGEYSLAITDQYGCEANATADVAIYNLIESISNDTVICQGDSVQLEVIAPDAVAIVWSPIVSLDDPSIATPFARPSSSTVYTVTVEDINGFTESASVLVEVTVLPILIHVEPINVCEDGTMTLIAEPGNLPGDYLWTWPSGTSTDNNINVVPLLGECFTLSYTAPNGCFYEDEICIEEFNEITVTETVAEDTVCRTESIVLSFDTNASQTIANVEWSPSNIIDGDVATLLETTTFSVTVTEQTGCSGTTSFEIVVDQSCVWPGDTDSTYVVNNFDLLNIGLAYDSVGPVRQNASLFWEPQPAESWSQFAPDGTNYKFIDCDGNGVINSDDTLGITQNWGEMHNFTGDDDTQFLGPNYPESGVTMMVPFYVEPDTLIENETFALPIILGESGNEAEDVYGLAFTLEYDSSVIVPGSASVGFGGWLGTINDDLIAIQKTFISPGQIDVGITRIDGMPMSGFGQLGTLYITIEDDVLLRLDNDRRNDEVEVFFNITNALTINNQGEEIPVVPMQTSSTLEVTVGTEDINWDEYIQVSPNPVDDVLYLTTKNIEIEKIKLFSITGALLFESSSIGISSTEVQMSHLNSGMYLLEVRTDLGVMIERIVVDR